MKKYFPIIAVLSLIKLIIHLIGNQNYGFHRDELLHLSVSEHLDWGYMEFPPFIALVGKISFWLTDYNLLGTRMFATFAGILILILTCLIAYEIGGKKKAVFFAGFLILIFLPFYRNHLLFQPVAFDQLFSVLAFYFSIKFLKEKSNTYLVLLGITLGIGFMNKYIIIILLLSLLVSLIITEKEKLLKNKWFYFSGIVALLIVLPNLIWQYQHDFPVFLHFEKLKEFQLEQIDSFDFLNEQLKSPFTFGIAFIGLLSLFFDSHLKKYKSIGLTVVLVFFAMWILKSKAYYFYGIYPVLFAFAAVKIEKVLSNKPKIFYGIVLFLAAIHVYFIPKAIPLLPIQNFIDYQKIKPNEEGRYILNNDYADMFGWEEQEKLVDSIYKSFSNLEQRNIGIIAENYGEAGALTILGKKYNLPQPICSHGSFWLFGPGNPKDKYITLGIEHDAANQFFEKVELIKMIKHPYAIEEENNIPVYLVSKPKINLVEIWPSLEKRVFN